MPASRKRTLAAPAVGLRLGLCCQFIAQPIPFRTTTATALARLPRRAQLARLWDLAAANAEALLAALWFCGGATTAVAG